jgi:signal transduction histidine kinase/ActR/RegA family two-component response regulator
LLETRAFAWTISALPTPEPPSDLSASLSAWDRLRRPVWLFDPVSCRGLYANPPAVALWDAESREELLARDFSQLSPAVRTRLERLAVLTAGGETVTERWSFYPQGKPVTVQAVISAFTLDNGADVLLFEAAPVGVEAAELRAVEALRHSSTLISLFDAKGRTTFANPAAFAVYGEAGRGFADRFADPVEGAAALERVLDGAVMAELLQTGGPDGQRWRHLDARRVTDPATGEVGVLLSERDVTSQIEAERALAAADERAEVAEAKRRFLANISHELRTPLTAVTGFAGLLARSRLDAAQGEHVARIGEARERLTHILNDIIDLAELDGGEMRLTPSPFDPAALLGGALERVRGAAEAKGLTVALDLPTLAPPPVVGDADLLAKMLAQLLGNALKFTERGGVSLRLEADAGDAASELTVSVIDTGPGLDAATQGRLFRRFTQGDDGVSKRVAGGGIGLAICRELADLMDGDVGVESTPGEGSRFWFRVRLALAEPAAEDAVSDAAAAGEPITVLYADDHESNRALVKAILESQGVRCDLACDGAEAVAAVREGAYDLVLMDIQMPGMDGVSAAREIRRLPGPQAGVPIVALTANTLSEQREAYAAAGMADCIAKPVNMAELLTKTAYWAQPHAGEAAAQVANAG